MIERTDFYSVPVQDMERAKAFYEAVFPFRLDKMIGLHSMR